MNKRSWFTIISWLTILSFVMAAFLSPKAVMAKDSTHFPTQSRSNLSGATIDDDGKPVFARADATIDVMLELYDAPSAVAYVEQIRATGNQLEASTDAVTRFHSIQTAQTNLRTSLKTANLGTQEIFSVQKAYNGIAVNAKVSTLSQLAQLPGIKAIHVMHPKTLDNAYSVPFINAPQVWQSGLGYRGNNIKVGVIDTGIDYLHTNFGGPGTDEEYLANDTTKVGDSPYYPSIKVAGGIDLAGDNYDADSSGINNIPHPDPDPMDCNGHGSHVSGTIAGYGVNSDGSTYEGSYGSGTAFESLRIGPGVAPLATLYAIRVFGCSGSTSLTTAAIDWAVDPNGDGDPSDHLDVINMSLGSSFGSGITDDAVASNNAAEIGMIVVASAGNSGDTTYITGSPAAATRAISVAASTQAESVMDGFEVVKTPGPNEIYGALNSSNGWTGTPIAIPVTADLIYPSILHGGCVASELPTGSLTGKIALLDWTYLADNASNECGSSARVLNAANAGAVGVIIAATHPFLDISIAGNAAAPSTITTLSTGNLLKAKLLSGTVTVILTKAHNGTVKNIDTADNDMIASFSSRGPRRLDTFLKPDVSAPGVNIFSTLALSGNLGESLNGTSMAAPHIAGVMALLRQIHPTWSVEELKALLMNTSLHDLTTGLSGTGDKFALPRVGAGRVDVSTAASENVIAYNADDAGAVSVSFGAVEVLANGTKDFYKKATVSNKNGVFGSTVTMDVAFSPDPSLPGESNGVAFTIEDGKGTAVTTVTLKPGESKTLTIHMALDGAKIKHVLDMSANPLQGGDIVRQYLIESGGYLTLSQSKTMKTRVPVYAVVRPVSKMATTNELLISGKSGSTNISLSGTPLETNPSSPAYPVDLLSAVTALQLLGTSPKLTLDPSLQAADIQYMGAMSDRPGSGSIANSYLYVGVSTWADFNVPSYYSTEFDIYISTRTDGAPEYVVYNTQYNGQDIFLSRIVKLSNGAGAYGDFLNGVDGRLDTAIFNNNVLTFPIPLSLIAGISDTNSIIKLGVQTFASDSPTGAPVDSIGIDEEGNCTLPFDLKDSVLDTTGGYVGAPLWYDLPNSFIPLTYNLANASGPASLLLLHHHNGSGDRAQIVPLRYGIYAPDIRNFK